MCASPCYWVVIPGLPWDYSRFILGSFWGYFQIVLGSPGIILGLCWDHSGIILVLGLVWDYSGINYPGIMLGLS